MKLFVAHKIRLEKQQHKVAVTVRLCAVLKLLTKIKLLEVSGSRVPVPIAGDANASG